jgi:hypothetical protein
MKKGILMLVVSMVVAGCAANGALIKTSSVSTRNDIFLEAGITGTAPMGYATLKVNASMKTYRPSTFLSGNDAHGRDELSLLVNLDGQALVLKSAAIEETMVPRFANDPESGSGTRYTFKKELYLKPGRHRIVVALPEDEVAVEREIMVAEGGANSLNITPMYGSVRRRVGFYGVTSHKDGIKGLKVFLNGKQM